MIFVSYNGAQVFNHSNNVSLDYPCLDNDCQPYEVYVQPGRYLIQCWGASGSKFESEYGRSAYTSGIISFKLPQVLYFYLGNAGVLNGGITFNGGGKGSTLGYSGGGSTDVRLIRGEYWSFQSQMSRIMVSGGGSGFNTYSSGIIFSECGKGNGGGTEGGCGYFIHTPIVTRNITHAYGGTQIAGGVGGYCAQAPCDVALSNTRNGIFGLGGNASASYGSGGGGGYFGGGSGAINSGIVSSGGGGSSFISGHPNCTAMSTSSVPGNLVPSQNSIHYSGFSFISPEMIGGTQYFHTISGNYSLGHTGNGAARIQFLGLNDQSCSYFPRILLSIHNIEIIIVFLFQVMLQQYI